MTEATMETAAPKPGTATGTPIIEVAGVYKRFVKSLDLAERIAAKLGSSVREIVVHAVDGVDLAIYVPTPTTTPVPDELTITCDGGVGSLSTDVVQTNPAGVRVTIDGGEAGGTVVVVAEAEPDDATVFLRLAPRASGGRPVSGDGSSYPPGRFEVRCGSLEDGDLSDSSPPVWFEVIDPGGNYGYRWSEPCVNATRTFVFVAPDELEAALVDTFGPSARVVPSGYRAASPAQLVVLVDDEPVGSAIEFPDRAQYLVMRCE